MARVIPEEIIEKKRSWKRWGLLWTWTNTTMGVCAALLSTLVAANARSPFLPAYGVIGVAMTAAGLTFLLTVLNADVKAKGFALAARELEAAIARYRFDDTLPERYLADAEVRGIGILNLFDSKKASS
jgi:hypothetical protein